VISESCLSGIKIMSFVFGSDLPSTAKVREAMWAIENREHFFISIGDWTCVSRDIAGDILVRSTISKERSPEEIQYALNEVFAEKSDE